MGRARRIALVAVLITVAGAGLAHAYWTTTGQGTGSAVNGTVQTVTLEAVVAGDAPSTTLVPGGTADLILRVRNPNSGPVTIHSVTANGAATADAAHPGCTTTGVSLVAPTPPVGTVVAAGVTVLVHLPGAARMTTAALSACQGARFTLPITLTVRR